MTQSSSSSARLPIKVKRIPGGFTVNLADGRKLWIYGREPEVARAANAMTLDFMLRFQPVDTTGIRVTEHCHHRRLLFR
jgi:hypothetical protein